jgi:hypothetical protein
MTVHSAVEQKSTGRRWLLFTLQSLMPQWSLVVLAIVLVATGYLGLTNRRLRDQPSRAGVERISLEQQFLGRNPPESSGGSVTKIEPPKAARSA